MQGTQGTCPGYAGHSGYVSWLCRALRVGVLVMQGTQGTCPGYAGHSGYVSWLCRALRVRVLVMQGTQTGSVLVMQAMQVTMDI